MNPLRPTRTTMGSSPSPLTSSWISTSPSFRTTTLSSTTALSFGSSLAVAGAVAVGTIARRARSSPFRPVESIAVDPPGSGDEGDAKRLRALPEGPGNIRVRPGHAGPEEANLTRKPALTMAVTIAAFLGAAGLFGDEGMWMPEQIPQLAPELVKMGLKLDPQKLADLTGDPMGAIVSLGGCSAS